MDEFKLNKVKNCDFCNSVNLEEIEAEDFDIFLKDRVVPLTLKNSICKDCGLIFRNPMPTPEELSKFYAESFILMTEHLDGNELRYDPVKKAQFAFIKPHIKDKGSVLEIGCYEGGFLSFFKGWQKVGVEPTPRSAKIARELYNVEVHESFFEKVDFSNQRFDVIVAIHLVEHLIEPSDFFKRVYDLLSPGGLFFVEVPNIELLSPESITTIFSFEHTYYFTPRTIANYFKKYGFDVVTIEKDTGYPAMRIIGKKGHVNDYEQVIEEYNKKDQRRKDFVKALKNKLGAYDWGSKRVLIYAAGHHTTNLFNLFDFSKVNIIGIVDGDKRKHGQKFRGFTVLDPNAIEELHPDLIIISSYACQNEIYEFLKDKRIEIMKLYNEVNELESFMEGKND